MRKDEKANIKKSQWYLCHLITITAIKIYASFSLSCDWAVMQISTYPAYGIALSFSKMMPILLINCDFYPIYSYL